MKKFVIIPVVVLTLLAGAGLIVASDAPTAPTEQTQAAERLTPVVELPRQERAQQDVPVGRIVEPVADLPVYQKNEPRYPDLGSHLDSLTTAVEDGDATAGEAAQQSSASEGESVAVTIHLSGNAKHVAEFLRDNGGDPRNIGDDYIEAYVPITLLGSLSEQDGVIRVREILRPQTR